MRLKTNRTDVYKRQVVVSTGNSNGGEMKKKEKRNFLFTLGIRFVMFSVFISYTKFICKKIHLPKVFNSVGRGGERTNPFLILTLDIKLKVSSVRIS